MSVFYGLKRLYELVRIKYIENGIDVLNKEMTKLMKEGLKKVIPRNTNSG